MQPDLLNLFQVGGALIVGLCSPDGEPVATRAWGLGEVGGDPPSFRVLIGARDLPLVDATVGAPITVTGADVATFRSAQVKGSITAVEDATESDEAIWSAYADAFFSSISMGDPEECLRLARLNPDAVVAVTVRAGAAFDQTPGPGAGRPLEQAP